MYDSQKEILNIVQDDTMNEDYNHEEYEDDEYDWLTFNFNLLNSKIQISII